MRRWQSALVLLLSCADDRFLCDLDRFASWANGRRQLRMDFFYRDMRRDHNILMDGVEPIGGKWNFDSDNASHQKRVW